MIKHISTKLVPLTQDFAKQVSAMPSYKGERPIKRARMKFLEARLEDGLFYPPRWALVKLNGMWQRANGHHSSVMLAARSDDFPVGMDAIVDRFEADSVLDVADLFGQFDNRKSSRTRGELVAAHGRVHHELDDHSPTTLTLCASGITFGLTDGAGLRKMDDEEKARLLHDYTTFAEWMREFSTKRSLGRASVIGAMFRTWATDSTEALIFWRWVRDENHPDKPHPSRTLSKFLLTNGATNALAASASKWTPRAFYVKCLHAWNAHRRGVTTDLHYHKNAGIPRVL